MSNRGVEPKPSTYENDALTARPFNNKHKDVILKS